MSCQDFAEHSAVVLVNANSEARGAQRSGPANVSSFFAFSPVEKRADNQRDDAPRTTSDTVGVKCPSATRHDQLFQPRGRTARSRRTTPIFSVPIGLIGPYCSIDTIS